ncbi:PTS glucitol/sorbitol transporter subunit IIA [Staphylococcus delphini]|uniref:PTS glucitol/sorbitol transporter subunit IIA n=1 Tax=Staphylococcus delphini TaxID=53344 RepID=UPI0023B273AC|nr:PTS glucitol/sorbitol transporter subunit IIA [Staphylococcus delphini]MDE9753036.1 PTS glucitol/sorbitol transporter subunit IIA [Staphylococcus delphini]MDE9789535.1 PTS glucitol/sorbitol transporter subunit IIA [Staphylococcus delphini]MDE9792235.1 PTS glucitol/sorbitol transporter subunit IIA [Staphylococcus delphini]MDE9794809.1 PTS glucitol/sorbitol transporter subunit IIA [Staphylococcus delphini]MDE9797044.1 PTS glucitol/sorbitol transporter subunit IIA [Staphylococcus delphini]
MLFKTKVKNVGEEARSFEDEKMIVLFGSQVPDELADFCYIIETNSIEGEITESNKLFIDGHEYNITKVGNVVNKNLSEMGHITLKFDGSTIAEQAGTLYLEESVLPHIAEGSSIEIG